MMFKHKKSLGQNFLNNPYVSEAVADAGDVSVEDTVLEIGPGTGALTKELLGRGAKVVAIEADVRAIETLNEAFKKELSSKQLVLFHADIKEFNLDSLKLEPLSFKVVANIPYYLSSYLLRLFLDTDTQPSDLVFLVQKEVADRIARDKKESLLSLSVKIFGTPHYVKTVKRGNFTPPPNVDSAILKITDIGMGRLGDIDSEFFFSIIHEGFKSKRKQLLGNLSKKYDRETLTNIFSTLELPLDVRAEDVHLEMWLKLCHELEVKM